MNSMKSLIFDSTKILLPKRLFSSYIQFELCSVLLPTNANLGRIMRIMEINIWLLEPLFVLNTQIFDINI